LIVFLVALTASPISSVSANDGEQRFADLGDLYLENGDTLRNARIGYRTFGTLNSNHSNIIVFPMYFGGQSEEVTQLELVGPGLLLDTDKYFVVVIDPLANGISSSPDQTPSGVRFPQVTIGDMVQSEYRLLTEVLNITHVKAVVGYSMGGMQAFEWLVAYPDFMDKAIPIVGSPRSTGFEAVNFGAQLAALDAADEPSRQLEGLRAASMQHTRAIWGVDFFAAMTPRDAEAFAESEFASQVQKGFGALNWEAQVRAALGQDISRRFGGSLDEAAAQVQADVLIIVHERDGWNVPQPALEFASLLGAQAVVLTLTGPCDHLSYFCGDSAIVNPAVDDFLGYGEQVPTGNLDPRPWW
jgi:homoserine O-acetyltransferase